MIGKMGPNEGFIAKTIEVQIERILDEVIPFPRKNVVH